ncbi:hypothetical protein [Actinoplanes sp. ATCC 53533]|uniref:hypothetical protein n=1 Tax=Actinoplanes sp. ATCC 53533 TaxID=1288362 RepID=UPI000F7A58FB|nr:hypothetical protein [Actinoplanes sp. ATCC 53533]
MVEQLTLDDLAVFDGGLFDEVGELPGRGVQVAMYAAARSPVGVGVRRHRGEVGLAGVDARP